MNLQTKNLFTHIPERFPEEIFTVLLENQYVRIERIVSKGHCSADGHWYDQEWDEWVLLLQGRAVLRFADGQTRPMGRGDYLYIPAHTRHRVQWTDPDMDNIWLAIHLRSDAEG